MVIYDHLLGVGHSQLHLPSPLGIAHSKKIRRTVSIGMFVHGSETCSKDQPVWRSPLLSSGHRHPHSDDRLVMDEYKCGGNSCKSLVL